MQMRRDARSGSFVYRDLHEILEPGGEGGARSAAIDRNIPDVSSDFALSRFIERSMINSSKIFARARARNLFKTTIYLKITMKQCCRPQERDTLHTRREIFNGNELSRNGKVDPLIFPGMLLSRRIQWNRVEKGTESRAHLCHFTWVTRRRTRHRPPPLWNIPRRPLPAISHPRNEPPPSPRPL